NNDKKIRNFSELQGFVEVQPEYIKHLHGSWLKYSTKYHVKSGGFLDKIEEDKVYLRCPSKENVVVDKYRYTFYVKETNENFISLMELISQVNKKNYSNSVKFNELLDFKNKMLKMINDGKIKFIK
ncbi:MAG: hypothetical protein RLZZ546_2357, partial [Bacteroidota bacterium]